MAKNIRSGIKAKWQRYNSKIEIPTNIKKICENINEYDIVLVAYENEEDNTLKTELQK